MNDMREIKFRGISIETGEFVFGNYIEKINPQKEEPTFWVSLIHNRALTATEVKKETVGQFTELKDKNGVEIYEGDIITTENYTMYGGIYKVFFDEQLLSFCFDKRLVSTTLLSRAIGIEVIGNIHQNPELLK